MKKILLIFLEALMLVLILNSCEKDDVKDNPDNSENEKFVRPVDAPEGVMFYDSSTYVPVTGWPYTTWEYDSNTDEVYVFTWIDEKYVSLPPYTYEIKDMVDYCNSVDTAYLTTKIHDYLFSEYLYAGYDLAFYMNDYYENKKAWFWYALNIPESKGSRLYLWLNKRLKYKRTGYVDYLY